MRIAPDQRLILGPPGTGKTTRLISEVESYLGNGYAPEEIAYVSFTTKAVNEARDRARAKFNLPMGRFPYFQTIHSLCYRQLGCTKQSVMGKAAYQALGEWLNLDFTGTYDISEGGLPTGAANGDKLLTVDSLARNKMMPVEQCRLESGEDISRAEMAMFSEAYAKFKANEGLIDFTDMLTKYAAEGQPVDGIRVAFIDEAQDLSRAQWAVLKVAFANVPIVIIAGDDDQSIYKWSGADLETFLALEGDKEVLSVSHRLPRAVHKKAHQIIASVRQRFAKEFTPRDEEGSVEYRAMLDIVQIDPEQSTMILVRNTFLLPRVYAYLHQQALTFTGRNGFTSVKAGHIQAMRVWEAMRRGHPVSYDDAKELYEHLRIGRVLARGGKAALDGYEDNGHGISYEIFRDRFGLLTKDLPWYDALEGIPFETREYYRACLRHGRKLSTPPRIHVNTIHGVKGGQADHVIVLSDMTKKTYDAMLRDPDQETRTAYVAVTRARQKLTLVMPSGRYAFNY